MSEDVDVYKNNIAVMMKIIASLAHASSTLIGRAANALMYQTGKDLGKIEGTKLDKTEDLRKALDILTQAEQGVWQIDVWKDVGSENYVVEDNGIAKAHLVFRECPIRQVCMAHGIKQDGVICRITHGIFAGIMGEVMGKKIDLHVEHPGPNACKKVVEIK